MKKSGMTLADLGEDGALARIRPLLPEGAATQLPSGDDAAVVAAPDGRFVVTTDVLVEGHHFTLEWSTAFDVGWRAAMQNLADVAAMGARPTGIVVALTIPPATQVAWLEDFARGLAAACGPIGCGVVGGDLAAGDRVSAAVTAFGDLQGRAPLTRSGARPGDTLALTGTLGHSAAGLALLRHPQPGSLAAADADAMIACYLRPSPPLAGGTKAADGGAHALMDVSDGLMRDAGRMAQASGVSIDVDLALLAPFASALRPVAAAVGHDPLDWVLTGGEDHSLLAAFPHGKLPDGWAAIGQVGPPGAHPLLLGGAAPQPGHLGFDHFRGQE